MTQIYHFSVNQRLLLTLGEFLVRNFEITPGKIFYRKLYNLIQILRIMKEPISNNCLPEENSTFLILIEKESSKKQLQAKKGGFKVLGPLVRSTQSLLTCHLTFSLFLFYFLLQYMNSSKHSLLSLGLKY